MADTAVVRLSHEGLLRLRFGATQVVTEPTVLRIEGPGAVECLQGLLTGDVTRPGPDSVVYGALLTPKGMIEVDCWSLRDAGGFTLVAPPQGHALLFDLLRRQLPPRLARITDHTGEWLAIWVLGVEAERAVVDAGLPWPAVGRLESVPAIPGPVVVARADERSWWRAVLVAPREATAALAARLTAAGADTGTVEHVEASRILAGWPALGREIGERTLPQEVRYDEIGGVSYTKGCYVGQETVARVHFRGHPNRHLRGLVWEGPPPDDATVAEDDRVVGAVTSILCLRGSCYGLAVIRRETLPGAQVQVGGVSAQVVELPIPFSAT